MKTNNSDPINPQSVHHSLPSWITLDYAMGHFQPATHDDFVEIDKKYADREGLYLHKQTYADFIRMWEAAEQDSVLLVIRSATRNFDYQKGIWERKWQGLTTLSDGVKASDIIIPEERAKKILRYSSMPGTSRHHWGTDIDLNSFENGFFESGEGRKLYQWLLANASKYGFGQPYNEKSTGRTGYEEEKWHWSYLPISVDLTAFCRENMTNQMIQGFEGSEVAPIIHMVENYILGISPNCL